MDEISQDQQNSTTRAPGMIYLLVVAIVHIFALLPVCWFLVFQAPAYENIFKHFGWRLSDAAIFTFRCSHLFRVYWWFGILVIPMVLAVDLGICDLLHRLGGYFASVAWAFFVFALFCLAYIFCIHAVLTPFHSLIETLAK